MTEFALSETRILGLMPESGIKRSLDERLLDPTRARGIPRAEIYLYVEQPGEYHQRALEAGAFELNGRQARDGSDLTAYSLDLDGHVLAFAQKIE